MAQPPLTEALMLGLLDMIKNLGWPKPEPGFRDDTFGLLIRDRHGIWNGEMPYRTYHVGIRLAGDAFEPGKLKLIRARLLMDGMEARVNAALDFAATVNPKLWRGKLHLSALDLSADSVGDRYALNFVEVGKGSGSFWQVSVENGRPVRLALLKPSSGAE